MTSYISIFLFFLLCRQCGGCFRLFPLCSGDLLNEAPAMIKARRTVGHILLKHLNVLKVDYY